MFGAFSRGIPRGCFVHCHRQFAAFKQRQLVDIVLKRVNAGIISTQHVIQLEVRENSNRELEYTLALITSDRQHPSGFFAYPFFSQLSATLSHPFQLYDSPFEQNILSRCHGARPA